MIQTPSLHQKDYSNKEIRHLRSSQCFNFSPLCELTQAAGPADAAWRRDAAIEKVPVDLAPEMEFKCHHPRVLFTESRGGTALLDGIATQGINYLLRWLNLLMS